MKVKRILSLVLVLIMVAALFVGCNKSDSGQSGVINEEITKTISLKEVSDTFAIGADQSRDITFKGTIKIGNTAATTGAFAKVGDPFNKGLLAYINRVNFNGGLGGNYEEGTKGYYVEFLHYDDGFEADKGSSYTKKLVEEDKVFALVGHFGSPTVGATVNYIKEQGVITCYLASGVGSLFNVNADSVENGSTIFPVQPIYSTEGRVIVARILEQYPDAKKIGIVYTNDEAGEGLRDGAVAQIDLLGEGYSYVLSEMSSETTDASTNVAVVKDCDVVIVAAIQKGTVTIIKAMITNGIYKPCFTTYSVAAPATLEEIKPAYDGLTDAQKAAIPIYTNAWLSSTDMKGYTEFCKDVASYTGTNDLAADAYAMAGWVAATIFCEGVERVLAEGKELTNLTFVEAMESATINLKLGATEKNGEVVANSILDYAEGKRIGTTTMALLKNNEACNNFVAAADMKDFLKFMQTGDINDIK